MNKPILVALSTGTIVLSGFAPAFAQGRVQQNAMEKSHWYNAPREIQIIDEQPVVRDFREAPQQAKTLQLPNGPSGSGPVDGMKIGGGPGYRTPYSSSPVGLPKSGFGNQSNIPSSLMSPRAGLPNGTSSRQMPGQMPAPRQASKSTAPVATHNSAPAQPKAPQSVMTYSPGGNGYGNSIGNSGGSRTTTVLKGSLLSKVK